MPEPSTPSAALSPSHSSLYWPPLNAFPTMSTSTPISTNAYPVPTTAWPVSTIHYAHNVRISSILINKLHNASSALLAAKPVWTLPFVSLATPECTSTAKEIASHVPPESALAQLLSFNNATISTFCLVGFALVVWTIAKPAKILSPVLTVCQVIIWELISRHV